MLIPDFSSASFFSSLKSELETSAAKLGYKVRLETSWRTTDDEMVKAIRKAARKLAPWTARRSNQSILKESNPEYSLEGLMLKLKLQYFGHSVQRTDSLEKIRMLGKIEGRRMG